MTKHDAYNHPGQPADVEERAAGESAGGAEGGLGKRIAGGAAGESAGVAGGGPGKRTAGGGRRFSVIVAVLVFSSVMGGYYLVEYAYFLEKYGNVLRPYLAFIARVSAGLLSAIGYGVEAEGPFMGSKSLGVRFEIVHGCDALEPTMAFVAAVLASPVAYRKKLAGLLAGVPLLLIVNVFRIVLLFLIGVYFPKVLDLMHYDVGQASFIIVAVVFWAVWVQWATRLRKPST